jgi:hypothetical protein
MKFIQQVSKIRTVRQGDSKFMLNDGLVICPRAGFEINEHCPREYRQIIATCIDRGWLKPVAHVYGKELTMDALR